MNKQLNEIRGQLEEIAEREAMKLFRMARRLKEHGGSEETVSAIRNEAFELHNTGYPERLIDPFKTWKYAFKE